ncbi:MAG: NAD(P)/FAD-dependent oxidoreductase, partial [Cycloclasticus sp.]|nr:NAD(P)/FAD-dependent oxidoreductase [Cycloclasticus sp.]
LAYARKVPGKEEFDELLRYFNVMLKKHKINVQLNTNVTVEQLQSAQYDSIVLASGIKPRKLGIPGIDRPNVFTYEEAFQSAEKIGQTVLIIGAGGIAYDMAEFLTHQHNNMKPIDSFNANWGIDPTGFQPGALDSSAKPTVKTSRNVTILQRKAGKFGRSLGKTTGWIHQAELQKRGVKLLGDLSYIKIDDAGLHIEKEGEAELLAADSIIICAGQESRDELAEPLNNLTTSVYKIGGVKEVQELDAAQAISDGIKLAYTLNT